MLPFRLLDVISTRFVCVPVALVGVGLSANNAADEILDSLMGRVVLTFCGVTLTLVVLVLLAVFAHFRLPTALSIGACILRAMCTM